MSEDQQELLDVKAVAEAMGLSRRTIRRYCRRKVLKAWRAPAKCGGKHGGPWRIARAPLAQQLGLDADT